MTDIYYSYFGCFSDWFRYLNTVVEWEELQIGRESHCGELIVFQSPMKKNSNFKVKKGHIQQSSMLWLF